VSTFYAKSSDVQQPSLLGSHGVRTVDNLKKYCGITSETELDVGSFLLHALRNTDICQQREAARFEEAIVTSSKANGRQGITLLPGVRSIIDEVILVSYYVALPVAPHR